MNKLLVFVFAVVVLCITILSYTQVDLNLTLTSWQPYLQVQSNLTQLGYFNRGTNAILWTVLIALITVIYVAVILQSLKGNITQNDIKKYLCVSVLCGLLSYSVFSHDIFNYIFDARIFTKYNLNPYEYKALDFPQDEWTRFMHWTHRTYPYGPIWLVLSVIPSYLGLQKILITLIAFKLLFAISYVVSVVYVGKILALYTKNPRLIGTGQLLLALHPLILIDGLVSPHLDITMAALLLAGLYYYLVANRTPALLLLIASIGIKYITLLFIPILMVKNKLKTEIFFLALSASAVLVVIAQSTSRQVVQPWYFTTLITFLPLLLPFYKPKYIIITLLCAALPLWVYLYYAATGEWKGVLWFI